MLRGNTIPGLWEELIKYKCPAPAQKRLGGGGEGGWRMIRLIGKTNLPICFFFIFDNDISQCFYCSFYLH